MGPLVFALDAAPGEVIFVGAFVFVGCCIAVVLALAAWRTRRSLSDGSAEHLRWHAEFEDLPAHLRRCRHAFTGERPGRTCEHGFDCRACEGHRALVAEAGAGPCAAGERRYHRGHTWVERCADGTLAVGLDPLAERLVGEPERVALPPVGTHLTENATAFRLRRGTATARVLAPVAGRVVATGGPALGFWLRLQPDEPTPDLSHLLAASEARAWLQAETDRVQALLTPAGLGATLADGGEPAPDLPAALPGVNWDAVWADVFLEP